MKKEYYTGPSGVPRLVVNLSNLAKETKTPHHMWYHTFANNKESFVKDTDYYDNEHGTLFFTLTGMEKILSMRQKLHCKAVIKAWEDMLTKYFEVDILYVPKDKLVTVNGYTVKVFYWNGYPVLTHTQIALIHRLIPNWVLSNVKDKFEDMREGRDYWYFTDEAEYDILLKAGLDEVRRKNLFRQRFEKVLLTGTGYLLAVAEFPEKDREVTRKVLDDYYGNNLYQQSVIPVLTESLEKQKLLTELAEKEAKKYSDELLKSKKPEPKIILGNGDNREEELFYKETEELKDHKGYWHDETGAYHVDSADTHIPRLMTCNEIAVYLGFYSPAGRPQGELVRQLAGLALYRDVTALSSISNIKDDSYVKKVYVSDGGEQVRFWEDAAIKIGAWYNNNMRDYVGMDNTLWFMKKFYIDPEQQDLGANAAMLIDSDIEP